METKTDNRKMVTRSLQLDFDTDSKLLTLAAKFYEGNISMTIRESLRRMFSAEFKSEETRC